MRNDVKLGFAIGGVLLAVLIVYVLVVPGGTSQPRKVGQTTQPAPTVASNSASNRNTASSSDAGKVTLEPVTPAVPAVPPPSYTQATPAKTEKTDPFAPKTETASTSEPTSLAKASTPRNDDWNAILNQPPMLMTETPVASPTARTTPPAAASPSTPAPGASSSDTTFSAATPSSTPPISAEPTTVTPSASPTSQPSAVASSGSRTHRIAQGETFASISTAAYGSSKYYPQIIKANPGVDPAHLKIGTVINLPDIATPAVRPTASATPSATAGEPQHASAKVAAAPIDSSKEYRVQPGDSLYKISLKLYGKSDRQDKIFQLNKDAMGNDPHHLKVGQVLRLPEPPTQTTTASR